MFINHYFKNVIKTTKTIDYKKLDTIINILSNLRKKKGRIFFLGVGGSAANCSHAVNDFRKLCNIECYTPTDNAAEFTARTNDDGFEKTFDNWLKVSNLSEKDVIFIFSVGGGNEKKKISLNIVNAIKFAKKRKVKILSIVGRKDGFAYKKSNYSLVIPVNEKKLLTPITEAFQSVIWHLMISHPKLQTKKPTW